MVKVDHCTGHDKHWPQCKDCAEARALSVTPGLNGTYSTKDNVNHPTHYNSHPSGVECITITEHMNFNIGNAVKYLWRAGLKYGDGAPQMQATEAAMRSKEKHIEDLSKALWYIEREIKRLCPWKIAVDKAAPNGDHTVVTRLKVNKDGTIEVADSVAYPHE